VEPLFCNLNKRSTFYRYISNLFNVCTYFIVEEDKLIIIDPGKLDENVYDWLIKFDSLTKIIYITHEHFDHHYHANQVLNLKNTFLYLPSESFGDALGDSRKNLSYYYYDSIETKGYQVDIKSNLEILKTPGHSVESYCFIYDNIVFGGDTVIQNEYLVFKLPGGNKSHFLDSLKYLKKRVQLNSIVLPGHGNMFSFDKWII
jgi:hydroxyacylglutathione hydrolase